MTLLGDTFSVQPNLTYQLTELVMLYIRLTRSLEGLCERHSEIDFRQGQDKIFQAKLFCIRSGLWHEAKYRTT